MRSLLFRTTGAMIFLVALAMVVSASDKDDEEQPGKGKGKGKGKSDIVQVDLSKLHPGIAQYVRENALVGGDVKGKEKGKKKDDDKKGKGKGKEGKNEPEPKKGKGKGKGEAKSITLADAISIGERSGTVVKAERRGDGSDATYRLEIRGRDGDKTKLTLDSFGRPTDSKNDEKGKSKGKVKGKDEED